MFETEARWLRRALDAHPPERLSPLLDLGSNDRRYRERDNPWIERELFAPLRARGIAVVHVDRRVAEGIDLTIDLTRPGEVARLRHLAPRAMLCNNLLEHVPEPEVVVSNTLATLGSGGLMFVSVPRNYPYHADPIDTMYRPDLDALREIFTGARMHEGCVLGAGIRYRDQLRRRPVLWLRHMGRLPAPFLSVERWRRSIDKVATMNAEYRITCAVFEKH